MVDCQSILKIFYDYLDGQLDKKSSQDIDAHLEACRNCFSLAEFERLLRDHIRKQTNYSCPDKVKDRINDILHRYQPDKLGNP